MDAERKARLVDKWIESKFLTVSIDDEGVLVALFRDAHDGEIFDFKRWELVGWRELAKCHLTLLPHATKSANKSQDEFERGISTSIRETEDQLTEIARALDAMEIAGPQLGKRVRHDQPALRPLN